LFRYSSVILFESSDTLTQINTLRRCVANKFGGVSVLDLPVHVTVLKWETKSRINHLVATGINSHSLQMDLAIGELTLSEKHLAIWYPILNPTEVISLADILRTQLTTYGIPHGDILTIALPHLTLGYRDYSIDTLVKVFHYAASRGNFSGTYLKASRLAVCEQDSNDTWNVWTEKSD
jgi:hypothetical protein